MHTYTRITLFLLALILITSCKDSSRQDSPYSHLYENLPCC